MEFDATFLIAVISFILFTFIMNKIFYEPVLKIMQKRQSFVENNLISAEQTRIETQKQTVFHDSEIEKTRDSVRSKIAAESKQLKDNRSKIISEYKSNLYSDIVKEKENLKNSALEAKDILKNNIVDIAKNISSKIMGNDYNIDSIDISQVEE